MVANSTNFVRPSLKQLRERAMAEFNAKLPEADAILRNSVINVLACVVADMSNEFHGYLEYIAKQIFPDTADEESVERWGRVWGVIRNLASFATGKITVKGIAGSEISSGTKFKRGDGTIYLTTDSCIVPANGTIDIGVKSESIGFKSNAKLGTKLTLLSPVAGVLVDAFVTDGGITGGTERENIESYTNRILLRIQKPPRGGSKTDYEQWALECPGVTRAWCIPTEMGAGTVGLRFMMDESYDDGIPTAGDIERIKAYVCAPNRKPVTAEVFVNAPLYQKIDIKIDDLIPNTQEVRDSIKYSLKDLFKQETNLGCTVYISKISEAISVAVGVQHFTLSLPTENTAVPNNTIPILGLVTFGGING